MSLSDKREQVHEYYVLDYFYSEENIKKFIKKRNGLLQEYLDGKIPLIIFLERIDKLAGDELK